LSETVSIKFLVVDIHKENVLTCSRWGCPIPGRKDRSTISIEQWPSSELAGILASCYAWSASQSKCVNDDTTSERFADEVFCLPSSCLPSTTTTETVEDGLIGSNPHNNLAKPRAPFSYDSLSISLIIPTKLN
jgi:hypothetical protein